MTTVKPSPAPWAYEYNPYTVRLTGDRDSNAAGTELPAYEVFDAEGNKVFDTDEDMPGEIQEANACRAPPPRCYWRLSNTSGRL